jgi:hypothetical protein
MGDRPQAIINEQVLADCDLLIAAFWTRLGSPTGTSPSGTVEEINGHVAAGKPAMIYFSLAPVRLDSVEDDQYQALKAFRDECSRRGLYETYETMEEFRQKLFRQLSQTIIREYPQLSSDTELDADSAPPRPSAPAVSPDAKTLLLEASQDRDGLVLTVRTFSGVTIKTNGRDFVTDKTPREAARWEGAIEELAELGALEPQGAKHEIYRLTHRGYELADLLRTGDDA